MDYTGDSLKLTFKKRSGGLVERKYLEVPKEIGCGLFYKQSAKEVLSFFAKYIRKKFKVEKSHNKKQTNR